MRFWTLVTGTVSQALLTINSSVNFLMYPAISKDFRIVFKQYIGKKFHFISELIHYWKGPVNRSLSQHSNLSSRNTSPTTNGLLSSDIPDEEAADNYAINLVNVANRNAIISFEEERGKKLKFMFLLYLVSADF